MNNNEIDKIKKFLNEQGYEVFLTKFFTNYFYEIGRYEIKSYLDRKYPDLDPGYVYYLREGQIGSYEEITNFEEELKQECNKIAKEVISNMSNEEFQQILRGEKKDLTDFKDEFIEQFHDTIENLMEEIKIE